MQQTRGRVHVLVGSIPRGRICGRVGVIAALHAATLHHEVVVAVADLQQAVRDGQRVRVLGVLHGRRRNLVVDCQSHQIHDVTR